MPIHYVICIFINKQVDIYSLAKLQSLKDGYVGLSSINLNRINDAYVITYGNSIIENEKFHLQPDATYIICNYSIPDAKSHALEFKTNPRGTVKFVKEVK